LYRMSLVDGSTDEIWDGLPGSGRFGWTLHDNAIYYSSPVVSNSSGRIIRRDLASGDETVIFQGRMPLADTTVSVNRANGQVLFSRYQAASDNLVTFDRPFAVP